MESISHKKSWYYGAVHIHLSHLWTPKSKVILIWKQKRIMRKLNCIKTICQKHWTCMNSKWWSRRLYFIRKKLQDGYWNIRHAYKKCKSSISTYSIMWRVATQYRNFLCSGWKLNYDSSKPNHVGFRYVFVSVILMSKNQCKMCHVIRDPHKLKVKHYTACMVDINKYLSTFPVAKRIEKLVR